MKKFVLNEKTTYYVYHDHLCIIKKDGGKVKFAPLPMQDVNDSEVLSNPEVAQWIYEVGRKALEVRDADGNVCGINPDALSKEEIWLSALWGKHIGALAEESGVETDDEEELTDEDFEAIRNHILYDKTGLSDEDKKRILRNLGIDDEA